MVRKKIAPIQEIASFFIDLKEKHLVQTRTVSQWTFEGYEDKLLQLLVKLNISNFNIPESKFGWFYGVSILTIQRFEHIYECKYI